MRIIISPAKKMNTDDSLPFHDLPCFLAQAEELKQYMQGLSYEEAKTLWKCNDRLADLNFKRFCLYESASQSDSSHPLLRGDSVSIYGARRL